MVSGILQYTEGRFQHTEVCISVYSVSSSNITGDG